MLSTTTDLQVDFRFVGRPARSLTLEQLLSELSAQGVDSYQLEDIAGAIARDGFFFGHHNYRRFAVFLPVNDARAPAGLLIVVREGSVQNLLSDTSIDATIVDSDYEPARLDQSPPEVVSTEDFQRIRSAVLAELAEADGAADAQPCAIEGPVPRQLMS
jgi:hypothetical protein